MNNLLIKGSGVWFASAQFELPTRTILLKRDRQQKICQTTCEHPSLWENLRKNTQFFNSYAKDSLTVHGKEIEPFVLADDGDFLNPAVYLACTLLRLFCGFSPFCCFVESISYVVSIPPRGSTPTLVIPQILEAHRSYSWRPIFHNPVYRALSPWVAGKPCYQQVVR